MKKSVYIVLCLLLVKLSMKAQDKDSILYIMPNKIELKLCEYINDIDSSKYSFEFYLCNIGEDNYRICISIFSHMSNNYWCNNTNRFILIDKKKYPLWFDYDVKFSTTNTSNLGSLGNREGQILKSYPIFDGYNITFTMKGDILFEDLGIFIRSK